MSKPCARASSPSIARRFASGRLLGLATSALLAAGFVAHPAKAADEPFPTRPVTIVVPYAAAGITDSLGRLVARRLTERWGKQEVYRHMEPIRLMPPCLACHGKPRGELDIVQFEKDGLEAGDLIGLMSVSLAVSD